MNEHALKIINQVHSSTDGLVGQNEQSLQILLWSAVLLFAIGIFFVTVYLRERKNILEKKDQEGIPRTEANSSVSSGPSRAPTLFGKIYIIIMMLLLFVGGNLLSNEKYQEWGIYLMLASIPLFCGFPWISKKYFNVQSDNKNVNIHQGDVNLGPSKLFVIPWCTSLLINIMMNIFLLERISVYVLLGTQFLISVLLTVSIIKRAAPELLKYRGAGIYMLYLIPMSSIVVGLIIAPVFSL